MFFVGLQEEMVVSGLLLLRKMDRAEKEKEKEKEMMLMYAKEEVFAKDMSLDSEELRGAVLTLPRERSTSAIPWIPSTTHTTNSGSSNVPNSSITSQHTTDTVPVKKKEGKEGGKEGGSIDVRGDSQQLVNNHSPQARIALEKDPKVVRDITSLNNFDIALYEYGKIKTTIC